LFHGPGKVLLLGQIDETIDGDGRVRGGAENVAKISALLKKSEG
jgi:hypothetical protein